MVRQLAFAFLLLAASASSGISQEVTARAFTDTSYYQVGDYIHYTIAVSFKKGTTVHPPMIADSIKGLSLLQTEKPVESLRNSEDTVSYGFILAGYDSEGVKIPPIPVFYQAPGKATMDSVLTNPVSFTVSTLEVNLQGGIKDVNGPLKIPLNWLWIALWAAAAIIVAAIIYYIYRRRKRAARKGSAAPSTPALPPDIVALNSLRELEKAQLWQNGRIKEYHSAITEIIRRYFEGRFGMAAMELPTSEAIELLKKQRGSEPVVETTYNFLSNADLVKFAKYTPLGPVNEEMMKQAYEIVNKSSRVPETEKENQAAGDAR